MSLEQFQSQHGAEWSRQVKSQAFLEAMILVSNEKLDAIRNLNPEDYSDGAKAIATLAEFSGWLKHEAALMEIPERTDHNFGDLGEPTYPSPEQELEEEMVRQNQENSLRSDLVPVESFTETFTPPTPPPKKRRKRRTKAEMLCQTKQ